MPVLDNYTNCKQCNQNFLTIFTVSEMFSQFGEHKFALWKQRFVQRVQLSAETDAGSQSDFSGQTVAVVIFILSFSIAHHFQIIIQW